MSAQIIDHDAINRMLEHGETITACRANDIADAWFEEGWRPTTRRQEMVMRRSPHLCMLLQRQPRNPVPPHAVCPYCGGMPSERPTCPNCGAPTVVRV